MQETPIENKSELEQNKDAVVKPEPETLHTPDPQDKMEGPISSIVQSVKEGMENGETKEQADQKKERKM